MPSRAGLFALLLCGGIALRARADEPGDAQIRANVRSILSAPDRRIDQVPWATLGPIAEQELRFTVSDRDRSVAHRARAAEALAYFQSANSMEKLVSVVSRQDLAPPEVRRAALLSLGYLATTQPGRKFFVARVSAWHRVLEADRSPAVRSAAARSLAQANVRAAIPWIQVALRKEKHADARREMERALTRMGEPSAAASPPARPPASPDVAPARRLHSPQGVPAK